MLVSFVDDIVEHACCFLSLAFMLEYRSNFGEGVDWRTRVGDISPLPLVPEFKDNLEVGVVFPFPVGLGRN